MTEAQRSNDGENSSEITEEEMMDTRQVAEYLGISYSTFSSYYYRGFSPKEDSKVRNIKLWKKSTIDAWNAKRKHKRG